MKVGKTIQDSVWNQVLLRYYRPRNIFPHLVQLCGIGTLIIGLIIIVVITSCTLLTLLEPAGDRERITYF